MAKKRRAERGKADTENVSHSKDGKQMVEARQPEHEVLDEQAPSCDPNAERQHSEQATEASSDPKRKRLGAARGVSSLHKVVVKKAQGRRFKITYNQFGDPIGNTRCTLQSYIGHLARTMIPIDVECWPRVDHELKEKLWLDVMVIISNN